MEALLITISESIEATSIGRSTLYQLIASGSIKTVKLGKRRLVDVSSLKAFIASLPTNIDAGDRHA